MRHDVVRQGAVPCLGAVLGVHAVLRVAELVQQVEGFDTGDELAFEERLAEGGVQHEVVGVQFAAAVAATRVHIVVLKRPPRHLLRGEQGGNNHRRAAMPLCSAKNRCVVIASWASCSNCMSGAA